MIKFFLTGLALLIVKVNYAQNFELSNKNIEALNLQIKTLEKKYKDSELLMLSTFPQSTASYFQLITKKPEEFLQSLSKVENFDQLVKLFPNLLIDNDLLIVKSIYTDYKERGKIDIKSFKIGNGGEHQVTLTYCDSVNNADIKYFLNRYTDKNITTIRGFYLKEKFKSITLPKKYALLVNYNDVLIEPENPIFLNKESNSFGKESFKKTIVDTLNAYFDVQTKRPAFHFNGGQKALYQKIDDWQKKKQQFADSLYKNDKKFRKLFAIASSYAEKNLILNRNFEELVYFLMPKDRALSLLRQKPAVGTCSHDEGPLEQLKKIASLAAETSNWGVYIKASLNILNDNVSRVAHSNIASENRKTYVEELSKLDLNINNLLIGSNLRIADTLRMHYFSDGSKIAQAYASLNKADQKIFEQTIEDILKNPEFDAFNKLHFYNTYQNYKNFIKDSAEITGIDKKIKELIPFLPQEVKSRMENSNKQLTDLLHNEEKTLSRFEIKSSTMGSISSYNYDGMCWKAKLVERGTDNKIVYDLTMPIGEILTPLSNFTLKMDGLKQGVTSNQFIQRKLNENPHNNLYVEFTDDKSFTNQNNYTTDAIPAELLSRLNFQDAISTYIIDANHKYTRYFLLKNKNVVAIESSKNINEKDKCQLFDESGILLY